MRLHNGGNQGVDEEEHGGRDEEELEEHGQGAGGQDEEGEDEEGAAVKDEDEVAIPKVTPLFSVAIEGSCCADVVLGGRGGRPAGGSQLGSSQAEAGHVGAFPGFPDEGQGEEVFHAETGSTVDVVQGSCHASAVTAAISEGVHGRCGLGRSSWLFKLPSGGSYMASAASRREARSSNISRRGTMITWSTKGPKEGFKAGLEPQGTVEDWHAVGFNVTG